MMCKKQPKCKKHPKYKAIMKPQVKCRECQKIWKASLLRSEREMEAIRAIMLS